MFRPRVIPVLLLKGPGLVKTVGFRNGRYVGDPINTVRIFNDKEADELIFLDITASAEGRTAPLRLVEELGDECSMPFSVGGGIRSVQDVRDVLRAGAEKVAINTAAADNPRVVQEAADRFGSSSVIVSMDVRRTWLGRERVWVRGATRATDQDPVRFAVKMAELGAGEILVTAVDRDGTMRGYDLDLIRRVADAVPVPVIACGGAGGLPHLAQAVHQGHASAVAAGSMFVYHGPRNAVLVSFPSQRELNALFHTGAQA